MFGAIVGDIIGSPYEFKRNNIKTTDFPLFSEKSRFTDDTVMTCAIADAIMKCVPKNRKPPRVSTFMDAVISSMLQFGHEYPTVGYGPKFAQWLAKYDQWFSKPEAERDIEPYGSFGNGSAMRVSPVAWVFNDIETIEIYADLSARVSHNHPEGIKGAQAVATAIHMAFIGMSKQDIRTYISLKYDYNLSRTLDEIRPSYEFDATCPGSVPEAITAFLESTSYEDAVRKAVSLGGDSDTIACIAGSIAEAFYRGVPENIAFEALKRLDVRLRDVLEAWYAWLR